MKQLKLWTTRLLSAVILLALGSFGQKVVAQDNGPAEGYYFISNAAHPTDALLYNNTGTDQALRIHYDNHVVPNKLTSADKPFIWEIKKYGDGYTLRNYACNMYIGRIPTMGWGEGAGFVKEPTEIQLPPSPSVENTFVIANVKANLEHGPKLGYQGVFKGEKVTGYWGDMQNPGADGSWYFDKIDPEKLLDIEDITETEGSLDDGYYFINFSNYNDPTTCMVPVQDGELWRLGSYPRDNSGYDNSFIWHVTKNADGKTYTFKNCGAQDLGYFEIVTKGPKESPYIIMTGDNSTAYRLQFLSNGCAYIYAADNDHNLGFNAETGNMQTVQGHSSTTMVKFLPVPEDKLDNALKLQEAVSLARGKRFTVGTNPGQVSQEDFDDFKTVLDKATEQLKNNDDHSALIEELNNATATLESKKIAITDGYYRFVNRLDTTENVRYLAPVFKGNAWYAGHDALDPTLNPSTVWHVMVNADGKFVMKNCGTQDLTYVKSVNGNYDWGYVNMSGTSSTTQSFKNQYSNHYMLYSSDNNNFWNGDYGTGFNGGLITTNNDWHELDGSWLMEKVKDEDIPFMTKLNEAITDAAGILRDSKVGPNPGDNLGDATALQSAIDKARTMYDEASATDEEVEQAIAELKEETKKFLEQDHSMRGIEDGYYYIVSTQDGFQGENRKIAMYVPSTTYLSWKAIEERNGQYLFNIKNLGDGTYSVQNVEFVRYIGSNTANGVATTSEQTVPQKFEYSNGTWLISNTVDNSPYTLKTYKSETSGVININDGNNIKNWTLVRENRTDVIDSILTASSQVRINVAMNAALQKAEPAYKNTFKYDRSQGLITEVNEEEPLKGQVWGTQVNDTYTSYKHLIDNDLSTCFQSSWESGTWGSVVEEGQGRQWLQVDLRDNPVDNFEFYFGLRDNDWGWKECWSNIDVYATNDGSIAGKSDIDPAEWKYVGNYTDLVSYIRPEGANMNSTGRYINYPINNLDQQYRYIRFIVKSTIVPQSCMMYTIGEFQIYGIELNEANSPYNYVEGLKPLADELKQLIEEGKKKLNDNTATQEDINQMEELTKKIVALTPNEEPINTKLAEVKAYVEKYSDEDNWGDVTSEQLDAMNQAIENAEDYDHDQPQQADLDQRLASLNAAFALYKSQQKLPDTNTWYYISNTDKSRKGYTEDGGTGSIWDRWCFGNVMVAPKMNVTREDYWKNDDKFENAVKWDGYDHASNALSDSIPSDPYAMWKLVKIEGNDEANVYALQNRATGYYMGVTSNHDGPAGMSATPVPYNLSILKSGQFNIICTDKKNTDKRPLHADGRKIVLSWESEADSPSSWTFEPVDEEELGSAEITLRNNNATIITLPYAYDSEKVSDLNADNNINTYGIKGVSENGKQLLLYSKLTFEAGEPMVVVTGDPTKYSEGNEPVRMFLPLANGFSYDVKPANGLVGTFNYLTLPANVGILNGDEVISTGTDNVNIIGQRGYVNVAAVVNDNTLSTDLTLNIKGEFVNNIAPATTVSGKMNVYTVDGVLVKKNVKAEKATQGLRKGVYIIGKQKVLVK